MKLKLTIKESTPSDTPGRFVNNAKIVLKLKGSRELVSLVHEAIKKALANYDQRNEI